MAIDWSNQEDIIKRRQAAINAGYKPAEVDKFIEGKQKENATLKLIQHGVLDVTDIAKSDPLLAQKAIESGSKANPVLSAVDKKNKITGEATVNFVDSLEKAYQAAGGGTFGKGPGARLKGAAEEIKGKVGLNEDAAVYNDSKAGFAATLKALTGDTGVLTDQDFERLSKLLPSLGSTQKEAVDKFNQLRDQMASKFGVEKTQTSFVPKTQNNRGPLASLLDIPFGPAVNLAEKAQSDLGRQVAAVKDQGLVGAVKSGQAKNIMDLLFPKTPQDVGLVQDILPAGVETGATLAAGSDLLKSGKNILGDVIGGKGKAIAAREIAAKEVSKKVSTNSIIEAGDKFVSQDPTAKKLWMDTVKPALQANKELSVPDLLEQIQVWNDAYTSAGKVGKTALAGLNDALARSAKQLIKTEAPEVAKQTAKLAKIYGLENTLNRFGPAAVGGAGAVAGASIIQGMLGQKR
jgi:hypothetical protein